MGDCWYVIVQGSVDVVHDGTPVAQLRRGDNFGEIALLRNVPRTASVVARERLDAYRLDRSTFLAAVTGDALSVRAADSLVGERLTALGHGGPTMG
jgi:CRP-like cAMP-binding protein